MYVEECKSVMYADDTSLMCKAKNVSGLQTQLESYLSKAADWLKANNLTLNVVRQSLWYLVLVDHLISFMMYN